MKTIVQLLTGPLIAALFAAPVAAEENVRWDIVQQITEESFNNSTIMESVSWLADVFGPRNVNTPSYKAGAEWARDRLKEFGLDNAHLEPYPFGKGYLNEYVSIHMMAPQYMPIIAHPAPWSSGTDGKIRANVLYMNAGEMTSESDLEPYKGKLKDAIVFVSPKVKLSPHFDPTATKWTDADLDEMTKTPIAPRKSILEIETGRQNGGGRNRGGDEDRLTRQDIVDFIFAEGAVAMAHPDGSHDFGTVSVSNFNRRNNPWNPDMPLGPTELVLAAEHYNRIMRILEKDVPVEMEIEVKMTVFDDDLNDHNVIAEIPGSDKANEIVIVGGHLQSVPVGTGATDNAVGASTAMEVARILKAIGVQPRRTIRIGLWGGHDGAGLAGNRSHVGRHFADRNTQEYKKDYHNFTAYFDLDHGTGRIRAVSMMGNEELRSIFSQWMQPLHPLGMKHLVPSGVAIGGNPGYHEAYAEVGLAGFYFYQDRMDMNTNAHTTMDMLDRLVPENVPVNAIIVATFVYHAAMREEKLPRVTPLPWQGTTPLNRGESK